MTVTYWTPLCMWPSQVRESCEHDGEIVLCNLEANYFAEGYSYCEKHIKEFVQENIDHARAHIEATQEYPVEYQDWGLMDSPDELQRKTDDFNTGEWSFNDGGDE